MDNLYLLKKYISIGLTNGESAFLIRVRGFFF